MYIMQLVKDIVSLQVSRYTYIIISTYILHSQSVPRSSRFFLHRTRGDKRNQSSFKQLAGGWHTPSAAAF